MIEAYYNDVKLGELNLTISKDIALDIGNTTVKMDARIKTNSVGNWILANKDVGYQPTGNNAKNYDKLIRMEDKFINLNNIRIAALLSIEGRPYQEVTFTNSILGQKYKRFLVGSNIWEGEAAAPYDFNLQDIASHTVVSISNGTNPQYLENKFTLLGDDERAYKGNFIEEFVGEEATVSEALIDFSKSNATSATWAPNSTGDSNISDIKMNFTSGGKVFDTRSAINLGAGSSADKLVVKDTTGSQLKSVGLTNGKLRAVLDTGEIFEIDNDGNLTVQRREEPAEESFILETYYQDILLGKMTLTLKRKVSLKIEGDDTFDFGKIQRNKNYKLNGKFTIKNENNVNIIKIDIPKSAKMLHETETSNEIPLTINSTTHKVGTDVEATIDLEARTAQNQLPGKYKGDIMITVTID